MIKKGDRVGISGELTNRKYTDKNGVEKSSLDLRVNDLTLLGSKDDTSTSHQQNNAPQSARHDPMDGLDDSPLPF